MPPAGELLPIVEDGIVRNAGGTILGADNKAAVAVMLEAVRRLVVEQRPHAGVELVLTLQEELTLAGARALDLGRVAARTGFVYDQAGPIGEIIVGAPHQRAVELVFHGRSAHAGMVPERGRSAIAAAAAAVARLRLGRLDHETTANAGTIHGGTALNVVPDLCTVRLDVRSHDDAKLAALLQEILDTAAFAADEHGCTLDARSYETCPGYRHRDDDPAVALAAAALARAGYAPQRTRTGGGADTNVLLRDGCTCVTLSNGMEEIHTPDEHISVADLEGMVAVTLALVDAALEAR